jgi:hypothetical protein
MSLCLAMNSPYLATNGITCERHASNGVLLAYDSVYDAIDAIVP